MLIIQKIQHRIEMSFSRGNNLYVLILGQLVQNDYELIKYKIILSLNYISPDVLILWIAFSTDRNETLLPETPL
jgi:hypothetical protein